MKTRDVSKLSCVVLGESGLKGQVLVSWDDAVGFAVYEFRVAGGDTAQLKALHGNQNHVYYCIEGKCSFNWEGAEMGLTADQVLALTADAEVELKVKENMRLVAVSVPGDSNATPQRICVKSLGELIGSERDVDWVHGRSRRFLTAGDGYNIGIHNTTITANTRLQYRRHFEGVYVIKGDGTTYSWDGGQQSHTFVPDGTMFLMDKHDAHTISIEGAGASSICVFFPALKGDETHTFTDVDACGFSSY